MKNKIRSSYQRERKQGISNKEANCTPQGNGKRRIKLGEGIKIRVGINEIDNRKTIENIHETQIWVLFFF